MQSVITIADLILRRLKEQEKPCTSMQIVKLCYIAYGWSLAILDKKIFYNTIEAWRYGPVIPDLYRVTKAYGKKPIPFSDIGEGEVPKIDEDIASLLEQVVDIYGDFDGIDLSSRTHEEGSPWDLVNKRHGINALIPDDLIKEHYQKRLDDAA